MNFAVLRIVEDHVGFHGQTRGSSAPERRADNLEAMPLATHLMFKYSDVLADPTLGKGERSPRGFHEQLQRCGGDTPLNVFATINNRLALDKFSSADHLDVEREFLSDSTRGKLLRARRRRAPYEPESVVFTRVGSLLALKLLLGLTRTTRFKETAVGAVALH